MATIRHHAGSPDPDLLAVEEPLEIRLGDTPIAVTMRTPGHDEDLVRGFLLTEAILGFPAELAALEPSSRPGESRISVRLAPGVRADPQHLQRNLFISSSCGVCGKASIENVRLLARPVEQFPMRRPVLARLTTSLRKHQPVFDQTGGVHAAALFRPDGSLLAVREDVGRHNAVDKAIGAAAVQSWPLGPAVLVVSGRQSFEIVQKAAVAGIGAVVGVSAPSSLAVELAVQHRMILVGFARGTTFNVYSGADRILE